MCRPNREKNGLCVKKRSTANQLCGKKTEKDHRHTLSLSLSIEKVIGTRFYWKPSKDFRFDFRFGKSLVSSKFYYRCCDFHYYYDCCFEFVSLCAAATAALCKQSKFLYEATNLHGLVFQVHAPLAIYKARNCCYCYCYVCIFLQSNSNQICSAKTKNRLCSVKVSTLLRNFFHHHLILKIQGVPTTSAGYSGINVAHQTLSMYDLFNSTFVWLIYHRETNQLIINE